MKQVMSEEARRSIEVRAAVRRSLPIRRLLFHALVAAPVALTQTLAAQAADATTSSATTANSASTSLAEIVVTASKRSQPLSKVALAVSALTQDQLTTAGVVGLEDLTAATPSVEMKMVAVDDSVETTIRGITNSDFNPGGSPAVATYIDGIYVARTQGLNGDLYDLDRIEVLRGPQGTLYGRNSTGGNINIVTADPKDTFGAAADVSYGSYRDVQTHAMVNLPITDDLAVRGSLTTHHSDGYFETQGTTGRNYAAADDYAGRLTALWTPSSNFKWRLAADYSSVGGTPDLEFATGPDGRPLDGLGVYDRPVSSEPEPSNDLHNFMVRSRMELQLGSYFSVNYLAGYEDVNWSDVWALAATSLAADNLTEGHRTGSDKSYSQEIDFNFNWNGLKNILGANYLHESERDFDDYPAYTLDLNYRGGTSLGPTATDESWGVFDQATYTVMEGVRLTGGVRYSSENKGNSLGGFGQEFCPVTLPIDTALSEMYTPGCTFSPEAPVHGKWSNTNWKAGVEYDVTDAILAYASVTTGFKAGGLNIGGNITPQAYRPEKVTNYEAGLKGHFFDNRVTLYADGFYMSYKDLQVTQLSGTAEITNNAAKAKIYGTEIEGEWQVTPKDHVNGFFDYLHATYTDYQNAVDQLNGTVYPSLSGNTVPNAPRWSFKAAYSHQFDLPNGSALTPSVAVYYQSHSYLREFDLPIDTVQSYSKTSLNLGWTDATGRWNVNAYAHNLENSVVRNGGITAFGLYWSTYDPPRTYGVSAGYKF